MCVYTYVCMKDTCAPKIHTYRKAILFLFINHFELFFPFTQESAHTYIYTYIHTYIHTTCLHIHTYIHIHIHTMRLHIHTYNESGYTYIHMYIHTNYSSPFPCSYIIFSQSPSINLHIHTYTCIIRTHTSTHTHTYIHKYRKLIYLSLFIHHFQPVAIFAFKHESFCTRFAIIGITTAHMYVCMYVWIHVCMYNVARGLP
jgi:hypothetical protein